MNQKGFANIILVVVIVALVGAVGYFAFIKKSEPVAQQPTPTPTPTQKVQTPAPTPTPTPSPTPTPTDPTISWKTYRISGYNGYEFKYPQSDVLVTGNELQNKILNASGYWSARGGATDVAVISSQSTFSVGRHGYIANLADCKKVTWPNDQTEELTTTKVINGITYYFGTYTGAAAGTQTRFNVYHAFGGSGGDGCFELVVSVSPLNGSTKVSDQILSTFKFTNQTKTPVSPTPTQTSSSLKFITPAENQLLIRGTSAVITWQGKYNNELKLEVVSTPMGSTFKMMIADRLSSTKDINQTVWSVPCNIATTEDWHKLILRDMTNNKIVVESDPFFISKDKHADCSK